MDVPSGTQCVSGGPFEKWSVKAEEPSYSPPSLQPSNKTDVSNFSKAALKMRRYRQSLKEKGLWEEYRAKENRTIKKCRANMSEEKKEREREQAKIRSQRNRDKHKAEGLPPIVSSKKKNKNCMEFEEKRNKDRLRQQKYRAGLSAQKKTAINKKRREQRLLKNPEAAAQNPLKTEHASPQSFNIDTPSTACSSKSSLSAYNDSNTLYEAAQRVEEMMPSSPEKYAAVVDILVNTKSPQKRAALDQIGLYSKETRRSLADHLQKTQETTCQQLKQKQTDGSQKRRGYVCRLRMKSTSRSHSTIVVLPKKTCAPYIVSLPHTSLACVDP